MATMSTVWDRAAEFLSDNLAAVMPLALVTVFVPQSLSGNLRPLMGTIDSGANLALGIILLLLSLVTVWGSLAITALALDPAGGRTPAMAAATQRFLPVVGISLLALVGVIMLALPFGIALGMSGLDMTAMAAGRTPGGTPRPAPLLFMALYVPLFALLILWFSARLAVLSPTILVERRGLGAFARTFQLTRPVQWKLVGVLILYIVVAAVAGAAAKTVFGSLFALLIGGEGPITLGTVLTSIIVAGISTVFSLISIAFIARLYLAARDAREAIVEPT